MKTTNKRKIVFDLSNISEEMLQSIDNEEIIFNSYGECDRYFDMWKGYTSELLQKKSKQLIKNKYDYEII